MDQACGQRPDDLIHGRGAKLAHACRIDIDYLSIGAMNHHGFRGDFH